MKLNENKKPETMAEALTTTASWYQVSAGK